MKNYSISSGNFTGNGNFSGYTALGQRIFIHKRQMESLGWSKAEEVKYPFFVIGEVKQIGQLDEQGAPKTSAEGTPVLVDRLQALSCFKSKQEMIDAHVDTATLDISIKAAVKSSASAAGLSEAAITDLLQLA